jgi:Ca2+-binding EF-hand superfamily protein
MEGEPLAMALLSQQLAAVLEHNGIASADEAFPLFDLDQDERISVADLFESCTEVQVQTSSEQVEAWIAHHAQQEDKSFLTLSAWCAALQHADGKQILKVRPLLCP